MSTHQGERPGLSRLRGASVPHACKRQRLARLGESSRPGSTRPLALLCALLIVGAAPAQQPKSYRLPSTSLKPSIIWDSVCDDLAFGGQDQKADDGAGRTRVKVDGQWVPIHDQIRKKNPLQSLHTRAVTLARQQKDVVARARSIYFSGLSADEEAKQVQKLQPVAAQWFKDARSLMADLDGKGDSAKRAVDRLAGATFVLPDKAITPEVIAKLYAVQLAAEQAAELLDAEPAPRALSPLVYDAKSGLYVLFGGDHLDFLMNDTWVFDPKARQWSQRHPPSAPAPRANHKLTAADGKITLTGGYTYTSSVSYVGGQYRDVGDGDWTYDVAANTWTGTGKAVEPNQRVYRTGALHPDFYLQGDKPDAKAAAAKLAALPANTWVSLKPPQLPKLNRDWGTAVLDPDRDLLLRFSGGHSAHGGTDVLHYHIATNRWELPFPVEFPLGQTYSNTEYPAGFNLNQRPWVTGHTYQSYGYDPHLKKMLFTGETNHAYVWDPDVADWTGRLPKPKKMVYGDCYYTLTLTPTPKGLVCWNKDAAVFRFNADKKEWEELALQGGKLPGAVVDNSTVLYDSKRDRLLFVSKPYGDKPKFSGQVHALDLKSLTVTALNPTNMTAAADLPYLCQLRYDAANDLVLVGATLAPDADGVRRTPAYDPTENRWVALKITGDDPHGKNGRNVSLGMQYDPKRKIFWAVDTNSNVYALRLDPKTADMQPLK